MRRREFLLASATELLAQPVPSSYAATPVNLRTAGLRNGGRFASTALEADCMRVVAYGAKFTGNPSEPRIAAKLAELDAWTNTGSLIVDMALAGGSGVDWVTMLLDLHEQFEVIETEADYSAYRLLIAPEGSKTEAKRLQAYRQFGGSVYTPPAGIIREAFLEALRGYVPKPAVIALNLPAQAEVTFLERRTPGGIRRVGHVLYYPDNKPGVLENVQLSFRLPQHPLGVITIPDQRPVEFVHNEFLTTFTLPRVTGHQAIAFE